MFIKLVLFIVVFATLFLGFRHWRQLDPADRGAWLARAVAITSGVLLLLLAVSGRLHWLFAILGTLFLFGLKSMAFLWRNGRLLRPLATALLRIPALRRIGIVRRLAGILFDSTIKTRYLVVTLEAATGRLHGDIRAGRHQGASLNQLELPTLLETFDECQADDREAAELLAAYLDQRFGTAWRAGRTDSFSHDKHTHRGSPGATTMSRIEALSILGLEGNPSPDDIRLAHRRLIQRFHPDRGGTDYLAAKINQAKDTLLT